MHASVAFACAPTYTRATIPLLHPPPLHPNIQASEQFICMVRIKDLQMMKSGTTL